MIVLGPFRVICMPFSSVLGSEIWEFEEGLGKPKIKRYEEKGITRRKTREIVYYKSDKRFVACRRPLGTVERAMERHTCNACIFSTVHV